MYCSKCGAQNNDTDRFCSKCGSQLNSQQNFTDNPSPFNPPSYTSNSYTQNNVQPNYTSPGYNYNNTPVVDSHMGLSIISILLCTPLGIAAIYNSDQSKKRLANGDVNGAIKSADTAKLCAIIGLILGGLFVIIALASH